MSHFGRAGPPDIRDTYSLLVLNITFRTTADDLFPLFDKYGKVVDVFIPRDRRTGDSRGFAFVRYKYADEAQKAVEKLDGRVVDGREIMVQFAKYGPNAERILVAGFEMVSFCCCFRDLELFKQRYLVLVFSHKGRILEPVEKIGRSRSRSPRPRHRDDYRDRDYRRRSRSRSRSRGKYEHDRYGGSRDRDYRRRSRSRSSSPDYRRDRGRGRYDDDRRRRNRSYESDSPGRRSRSPRRSSSPRRTPPSRDVSPVGRKSNERSPTPKSVSPRGHRAADSRSPSPRRSDADE